MSNCPAGYLARWHIAADSMYSDRHEDTADEIAVQSSRFFLGINYQCISCHRGRGIYRALVARRAAIAQERGIRYLQVDASDDSRPILERLGFTPLTTSTPYIWRPPA